MVETAQLLPEGPPPGEAAAPPQVVAVKRLKVTVVEAEDDVCAFIHEARLLIKLRHPSVIQYIGLGCGDTTTREAQWRTMYLVQEVRRWRRRLRRLRQRVVQRSSGGAGGVDCASRTILCSRQC